MLKQFLFFVLEQTRIENCSEGEQPGIGAGILYCCNGICSKRLCFIFTVLMTVFIPLLHLALVWGLLILT
jgi:hypothetical protein